MSITMEDIEGRLLKVEKNTEKILFYMESDPSTNKKGIVEGLTNAEHRIRLLELDRKIQKVQAGTIAGVVSTIAVFLGFVIQTWVNNNSR